MSLGEAEDYRDYYRKKWKARASCSKRIPEWKGHRVVDVRKPEWTAYAVDKLIPPILAQGFDGIMIDTMDSVTQLESDHPKKYPGMTQAAVELIKAVRARYPHIKIMLNRGFAILPQVAGSIDMVMAESIYSLWSPKKKPALVAKAENPYYVDLLHAAQHQFPALKIYTVEYWPPRD